jgi:hypothetical protein
MSKASGGSAFALTAAGQLGVGLGKQALPKLG